MLRVMLASLFHSPPLSTFTVNSTGQQSTLFSYALLFSASKQFCINNKRQLSEVNKVSKTGENVDEIQFRTSLMYYLSPISWEAADWQSFFSHPRCFRKFPYAQLLFYFYDTNKGV